MSRRTFMRKLMSYLKNISRTERQNVENFYNEMFDEQGIGLDDEVPESFGNPRKIAMEILAEDIEIEEEKSERSGRKKNSFWKKLSLVGLGIISSNFCYSNSLLCNLDCIFCCRIIDFFAHFTFFIYF